MDALIVSEVFGPTVQGEGPSAGRRCGFVRLGRCNLDCAWCDTPYTWDWHGRNGVAFDAAVELSKHTVADVAGRVEKMCVPLLVVSGGEPLLQPTALAGLVGAVIDYVDRIEIETNGTRPPLDRDVGAGWVNYNVSPKLASSGVDRKRAWVPGIIEQFRSLPGSCEVTWKFVIGSAQDARDAGEFVDTFAIDAEDVWVMPEGRSAVDIAAHSAGVMDLAVEHGWNVSSRLQVLAFGNERGH